MRTRLMRVSSNLRQVERRSLWIYVFAAWTLYGTFYGLIWTVANSYPEKVFRWVIPSALVISWSWALVTPGVFRVARTLTPARVGWVPSLLGHATVALVLAAAMSDVRRRVIHLFSDWPLDPFLPVMVWWLDVWVFIYITLVVVGRALDLQRRYADRTMRADLLETQLARTQLQYLESQLQPHFLFNALNTIQELAHEAPDAARRMLQRLRVLLSISLERRGEDEVTLRDELAALEPYLDIQRTRFSNWLTFEVDVPEELRGGMVPHLVLQPLVENAIRHGLSSRPGPGWVRIAASRTRGDRLRLTVEDDGEGLRGATGDSGGIGLANVVERLRQLHGSDHAFSIRNRRQGGVEVVIEVPWRPAGVAGSAALAAHVASDAGDPSLWKTGEFPGGSALAPVGATPATDRQAPATRRSPLEEVGEGTAPALSVRVWLGIAGVWLLLAVFWTNQVMLFGNLRPSMREMELWSVARLQIATSVIWLGLSLPVLWLSRTFRFSPENWPRRLPVHVAGALTCAFVHLALMRALGLSEMPVLSASNLNPLTGDFFIYLGILAWSHSRDFVAWYRIREIETARLTAQLARSRFQAMRVQLRPEFVLATMEYLESVVTTNAELAERLITRLADTLRLTLELGRRPTTSVARELELVSACIETHRLGVRPGVRLSHHVDSDAMTELVPSRLVCAAVDELLANVWLGPAEPLDVEIEATRLSGTTHIVIRARAEGLGRTGVSHAWWHRHGIAERAVELAGNTVSVLVPDTTSVHLIIGEDHDGGSSPDVVPVARAS